MRAAYSRGRHCGLSLGVRVFSPLRALMGTGRFFHFISHRFAGHSWGYEVPCKSREISSSELYLHSEKSFKAIPGSKTYYRVWNIPIPTQTAVPSPLDCRCDDKLQVDKNPQFLNTVNSFSLFNSLPLLFPLPCLHPEEVLLKHSISQTKLVLIK